MMIFIVIGGIIAYIVAGLFTAEFVEEVFELDIDIATFWFWPIVLPIALIIWYHKKVRG